MIGISPTLNGPQERIMDINLPGKPQHFYFFWGNLLLLCCYVEANY